MPYPMSARKIVIETIGDHGLAGDIAVDILTAIRAELAHLPTQLNLAGRESIALADLSRWLT